MAIYIARDFPRLQQGTPKSAIFDVSKSGLWQSVLPEMFYFSLSEIYVFVINQKSA